MSSRDIDDIVHLAAAESQEIQRDLRQIVITGLALTVPFFITVLVLLWVFGSITKALGPLVTLLDALGLTQGVSELVTELIAAGFVLGTILLVGFVARHGPTTDISHRVDAVMEDLPGIGSIYTGVERMSDAIVEGDTESFRETKVVEFPREESYALAFLTADTPTEVEDAANSTDMLMVFVPMAPNPVMGGHLLNLPRDRVHDVDLSVEEGMEAIMTTGMAIDQNTFNKSE